MDLLVKKLSKTAKLPERANPDDAAYDLFSDEDVLIPAGEVVAVGTGVAMEAPSMKEKHLSTYLRIAPRSGLAVKSKLDTFAGVVDKSYRGEVRVALFNAGRQDYQVRKGDRIAQLVVTVIAHPRVKEVLDLSDSYRGPKGFGSTGK